MTTDASDEPMKARAMERLGALVTRYQWWIVGAVTALYVGTIIVAAVHHEPWRDEVVPLSIARELPSLGDLWRMLRHEGHPLLWYLCLRYGYFAFGTTTVLPVASIVIATAAVIVFLVWAPLPLWLRILFVFGYFPLFEYSVVARGNGLAMLFLFGFCALHRYRAKHPVAVAALLALLANTTALGFVVAAAAGLMIVVDAVLAKPRGSLPRGLVPAGLVYLAGLGHAVASNMPDPSVLPLQLYHHDARTVLAALGQAVMGPVAHAGSQLWLPYPSLFVWLFFLVLLRRPGLLALLAVSLVGFELMFILVYPPSPRHVGYVVLVLMATLWLGHPWWGDAPMPAGIAARVDWWLRRLLVVPLVLALGFQAILGVASVLDDVTLDYSSSARLAALLAGDSRLEHAIVIGAPETLTQSLPYYRSNRIYLTEEETFRDWMMVQVPGGRREDLSLGELLETATAMRARYDVPIVMVLGWRLDGADSQIMYANTPFESRFSMTPESRDAFLARTEAVVRLRVAVFTDENYDVFVMW
jgi:hypothetical protein